MKLDQISEAYVDMLNLEEQAKWRKGYSASGHPAGFKHKDGQVGPLGGTFTNEPSGYDGETSKVPVQKHRDQEDSLQQRVDGKLALSSRGLKLTKKNAVKNLKSAIVQAKGKHGPVSKLPESVLDITDEELDLFLENLDEAQLAELCTYLDEETVAEATGKFLTTHLASGKPNPAHPAYSKHKAEYDSKKAEIKASAFSLKNKDKEKAAAAKTPAENPVKMHHIDAAISNSYPDVEPYEHLARKFPHLHKQDGKSGSKLMDHLNTAVKHNKAGKDYNDYVSKAHADFEADAKHN